MNAIYIPRIAKAPGQTEVIEVKQQIAGLETLTPVQGTLRVTHHGNYLEVTAAVEAIVTLVCDRCLQNYNHRLRVNASEMIWLSDNSDDNEFEGLEREVAVEDLVETLSPTGYFEPETWLYEHFCLSLPQRQLCDESCPGILLNSEESSTDLTQLDSRWASLASLKGQLLN